MIGTRLGPYEITAKLGEGGMGVVYKAKDFHLGRDVALKVLPEGFTSDPERLARFEREAKLLAQLNHPNIAQIHGLEIQGDIRALVMELVEGPTLAERLEHRPLPFDESLSICLQIALALEEAHEKGIVHRDLKPQNVKASVEGRVKVLDFGLAKAMDPAGGAPVSPSQLAHSPTLTLGATVQGVILGTAAYMAPEQAAGAAADRRADIWSFGVVLFELLTGRRLFEGDTVSHVLAGVLKDEPDFSQLPSDVSPRVKRLLGRCLRKKPRERLQSIGDARLVLEEVIAGKDREELPSALAVTVSPASQWQLFAAGALMLAGGLAVGRWLLAPRPETPAPLRLELAMPDGLSLEWGEGQASIALSADGRRLAVAVAGDDARSGILLRDFGEYETRLLTGTAGGTAPFFSPDGEWVGYFTGDALNKIPVAGGQPIRMAPVTRRSRGGAWGRDGFIYFSGDSDAAISRIAEIGGPVEAVTRLDLERQERTHRWPELSSDGASLLFSCDTQASPNLLDDARIEAVRLATGERHLVLESASQGRFLADDLLVYGKGGNIFAIELDPERLVPRGRPVALQQGVSGNLGTGAIQVALSRLGTTAWVPGTSLLGSEPPVWLTLDGKSTPTSIPASQSYFHVDLSPDGRSVALAAGGAARAAEASLRSMSAGRDIWIADLERQTVTRLSVNENADSPTWTPDGRRVAYRRTRRTPQSASETHQIVWRPADGSGEATVLFEELEDQFTLGSFSPDGRFLTFSRTHAGNLDIWLLPLDPLEPPRPFQTSPFFESAPSVSPDGRWIAYVSRESGDDEIYVRPFPEGAGRWQISTGGGLEPRWSADGALYFRARGGRLMRAAIEKGAAFRASSPEPVLVRVQSAPNPKTYGIVPDARRFLSLPFVRARQVRSVNYTDDWLPRARLLLARNP